MNDKITSLLFVVSGVGFALFNKYEIAIWSVLMGIYWKIQFDTK